MTQVTNYAVPNGPRASVRQGINAVLEALRDDNAGAVAPANPVPGMRWRDTSASPPVLRIRNQANSAWDTIEVAIGGVGIFGLQPIGKPFGVWDHITGCPIPSNAGTAKFIRLTAGQTGAGQYNNGLLNSESVSGSAPTITATATILFGPMAGQTVALINTEQAFIRPRTTSGVLQVSQFTAHNHQVSAQPNTSGGASFSGVTNTAVAGTIPSGLIVSLEGGDETRPRNRSATFYLRIA